MKAFILAIGLLTTTAFPAFADFSQLRMSLLGVGTHSWQYDWDEADGEIPCLFDNDEFFDGAAGLSVGDEIRVIHSDGTVQIAYVVDTAPAVQVEGAFCLHP